MALLNLCSKLSKGPLGLSSVRLFQPTTSNLRFYSNKKEKRGKGDRGDKKKDGCDFKSDSRRPPCSLEVSCHREVKKPNCYSGSHLKPRCLKVKKTTFVEAPIPNKTAWSTEPPFQTCDEQFPKHPEECCPECPYEVRLDKFKYYPRGLDRDFWVTWIDCKGEIVEKPRCTNDQYEMVYEYRPKVCRPKPSSIAQSCRNADEECKRIQMAPCCNPGRNPPTCIEYRGLSDCKKACVPVPAYSECCLLVPPYDMPTRGPQCYCLERVPLCIINRELTRIESFKKKHKK